MTVSDFLGYEIERHGYETNCHGCENDGELVYQAHQREEAKREKGNNRKPGQNKK